MSTEGPSTSSARKPASATWAVAALYLALTVLLAAPLSFRPDRTLYADDPDSHLFMWTLAWDAHAFLHQPLAIFDANIFFPNRGTLAYSENLIGSAFFAAPVLWLTGNPVLAVNAVSILSCVLCGLGAYVLGRRLGLCGPAAVLCGLIFAFSPPRFFRFSQLHLTVVQWMPFALASIHAYLDDGRPRDLHAAAGFSTLQALSSGHGALFLLVAAAVLLACRTALGEPIEIRRRIADFGLVGAVLLLPTLLLYPPYRMAQLGVGLQRGLDAWNTTPQSFLASPSRLHEWLLSQLPGANINRAATAYLFPGYLPIALAVSAWWWRPRRPRPVEPRPPRTAWTAIAVGLDIAVAASMGIALAIGVVGPLRLRVGTTLVAVAREAVRPWLAAAALAGLRALVARRVPVAPIAAVRRVGRAWTQWAIVRRRDPALPYLAITGVSIALSVGPPIGLWPAVYWLPGFNFIRVPSRFMILGTLGCAVLAGVGFDRLSARLTPSARRVAAGLVGLLLVAEFAAIPMTGVPYRVEIPAADAWLAQQRKPFVAVEVPVTTLARYHSTYMLHSTAHWQKIVNGYSGIVPPFHEDLYARLRDFPTDDSLDRLSQIGVTYVVVHVAWIPPEEWAATEARIGAFGSSLTLEYRDADARVYALHRPLHASGAN